MQGCSYKLRPYHWWMLNERLKSLRLAKGLTLQQVGDFFGISRASVASWESETNQPDPRKLEKLAEIFDATVEYLVTGQSTTLGLKRKTPLNTRQSTSNGIKCVQLPVSSCEPVCQGRYEAYGSSQWSENAYG